MWSLPEWAGSEAVGVWVYVVDGEWAGPEKEEDVCVCVPPVTEV